MAYEIGTKVRVSFTVRDAAGTPTNATTAVSVFRDDDTPYAGLAPATNTGTGTYYFEVTPDTAGVHRWTVVASGAVTAVLNGQFYVRAVGQRIISVEEAKRHLNKSATITTDDEELQAWIDATTYVIEREIGAVVPRQITESYDGGVQSITLRRGPVLSVQLVQEYTSPGQLNTLTAQVPAGPFTDNQYMLDAPRRLLIRTMGGYPSQFYWFGANSILVTYTIGRRPITENIREGALELVAHYWRASQFSTGRANPRDGTNDAALVGIALPNRVAALIGRKQAPRLG